MDGAFCICWTIVKMAIHGAGYRLGHLSRPEHSFSKTGFGIAVLNFARRLRAATSQAQAPAVMVTKPFQIVEAPFLGSTIRLAAGPVRVACDSSAPLLPVFRIKTARDVILTCGSKSRSIP